MRGWTKVLLVAMAVGCAADNTAPPPGDVERFDPVANFPAIAAYAGPEARLVEFTASYVRVDGTMDLTAEYRPYVSAKFVTKATAEEVAAQGPRAPGSGFEVGAPLTVRLSVRAPHWRHVTSGGSEWDEKNRGMEREPGGAASGSERFAEPPRCSFAELWRQALALGAPGDVVANIDYDAEGYVFAANGREFRRGFSADCEPKPE